MAWYPIKGGVVPKVNLDAKTITPGTKNQVIEKGTYLKGPLTILGDADLISSNIKKGVNIFGVMGSFEEFLFGLTKEAHGSFTPSSDIGSESTYTLEHNLGQRPKFAIIYTNDQLKSMRYAIRSATIVDRYSYDSTTTDNSLFVNYTVTSSSYSDIEVYTNASGFTKTADYDENKIPINLDFDKKLKAGVTYYWQVLA